MAFLPWGLGTARTTSARLDRRVRREARALVRQARAAIDRRALGQVDPPALAAAAAEVEGALAAGDLARVRRGLPPLDFLIDELAHAPRSAVLDLLGTVVAVAVAVLAIRAFVVEAFKIPS